MISFSKGATIKSAQQPKTGRVFFLLAHNGISESVGVRYDHLHDLTVCVPSMGSYPTR